MHQLLFFCLYVYNHSDKTKSLRITSYNVCYTKLLRFIPETVTTIAKEAFSNSDLTSVIIPNSVTYIGNYAFYENAITSVVISDSVKYIGRITSYNVCYTKLLR